MEKIIASLLLLEKNKKLQDDIRRLSRIIAASDACSKQKPQNRPSRIPIALSVIEKKREDKEQRRKSLSVAQRAQGVASASSRGTHHSPKPPCSCPPAQASFRQKRAAQLRAEKIRNFETPQPPCQPARQSQVGLRPLQLKKTCSNHISVLGSHSLVNSGFRYFKPLPPIGSPASDLTAIQDHKVNGIQEHKKKPRPKYNYLGRFEKEPEAYGDKQRELKAPRFVCEKPKQKKVQTKRRSKYNYLGRFTKDPGSENDELRAKGRDSCCCDADHREESRGVDARPRFTGALSLECGTCGRRFAEQRLEIHAAICSRLHDKNRSMFHSSKHRVKGTDLERYVSTDERAAMKMSKSKNINTSAFVTCPHCCCRIPPRVAQIHIPKCAAIRNKIR